MSATSPNDWYRHSYRRLLVDMHIPDWDPRFLADLDAGEYVATIQRGHIDNTMLYCNSHVGHAFYPSKLGPVHAALRGKDFVGDVVTRCHEKGISVVAYYSATFNNEIFLREPDWRMLPIAGEAAYEESRYGICCPNSPYRDFAVAQTEELCSRYPFEGIFFDMLFWPYICYCRYCRQRFLDEQGSEIPTTIDWNNPVWMAFQRARERWMSELAGDLTAAAKRARPSITAVHQLSPALHDWRLGLPFSLAEHCDYTCGDFYGPAIQQSLVCKLFESLSQKKPFEFHTSRCTDLRDHVTMKSPTRMETQASLAVAHGSAFLFIDGIEPTGRLNQGVYERINDIFSRSEPYEKFLGGDLVADVAIYFSSESRFDFRENGCHVSAYAGRADNMASLFAVPHLDAVKGAARALQEEHIPYAIITRKNLDRLRDYRVVILPNVLLMTDEEIALLRDYVAGGGALYASGYSSLVAADGTERPDFGLADVFGVSKEATMAHRLSFIRPTDPELVKLVAPQEHIIHQGGFATVRSTSAETLAELALPWCPENGGSVFKPSFASIHSNPPSPSPFAPAILSHRHGKGFACYAAGAIEAEDYKISRRLVTHLVRRLLGGPARVEASAPSFVELTAFDKPAESRLNISLVSLAESEDSLPSAGSVQLRFEASKKPVAVRALPSREDHPWRTIGDGGIEFDFSDFQILKMFEVEYEV